MENTEKKDICNHEHTYFCNIGEDGYYEECVDCGEVIAEN